MMGAVGKGPMDNALIYLVMILVPVAIMAGATWLMRRQRMDREYIAFAEVRRRASESPDVEDGTDGPAPRV